MKIFIESINPKTVLKLVKTSFLL